MTIRGFSEVSLTWKTETVSRKKAYLAPGLRPARVMPPAVEEEEEMVEEGGGPESPSSNTIGCRASIKEVWNTHWSSDQRTQILLSAIKFINS